AAPPTRRTTTNTASARPTAATSRATSFDMPAWPTRRPASASDHPLNSTKAMMTSPASPTASRRKPRQKPRSPNRTRSSSRIPSRAVITCVRPRIPRAVSGPCSCHGVACRASDGPLACRHGLLLPSHAGLLVVLAFPELCEDPSFLALFLESTDGAVDGLVLLDSNPCHARYSPPLGGKVDLIEQKRRAVKGRAPVKGKSPHDQPRERCKNRSG